jgi:hypothetical protein
MKYTKIMMVVLATVLATAGFAKGQDLKRITKDKEGSSKTITVQGEVVDLACYMTKGEHGSSHADCAEMCINGGEPVGILDKSGHVYLCVAGAQKPANSLLAEYAAKQVKVTGTLHNKGGMDLVAVDKVEPLGGTVEK